MLKVVSLITALVATASAALFEPPNGRLYLSIWHENGEPSTTSPYLVKDSPSAANQRLGRNAASYQYAQYMPVDVIPESGNANTDAFFYLSVYPTDPASGVGGFEAITQFDVDQLAQQLFNVGYIYHLTGSLEPSSLSTSLPEMNGNWYNSWHGRPLAYVQNWRRIYDAVVSIGPKDRVAFVWAPNYGIGYPYGGGPQTCLSTPPTTVTVWWMDVMTPFSPWYPGDQYVDWGALSIYFKPFSNLDQNNVPNDADFNYYVTLQPGGVNFYDVYATQKNKPFMISESGAAFDSPFFQPFWRQYVTNSQTLDRYPLMMITLFEHMKVDDSYLRDFRITANSSMGGSDDVIAAFRSDLNTVADRYIWANATVRGAPSVPTTVPSSASGSSTRVTAPATVTPSTTITTSSRSSAGRVGVSAIALILVVAAIL
ncbi:hypothetical protein BC829DRAFT_489402 [Chytridium lagenaria]|nr:hypothetical protein BC829DRAFT_489402 [Chytridium lagenaria]